MVDLPPLPADGATNWGGPLRTFMQAAGQNAQDAATSAAASALEAQGPTDEAVDAGIVRADLPAKVAAAVAAEPTVTAAAAAAMQNAGVIAQVTWPKGGLASGTDLNTLSTSGAAGVYGLSAARTYPNMPFSGAGILTLTVNAFGGAVQEIARYASTDVWRRSITNPTTTPVTWGAWARADQNTFKGVAAAGSINAMDTIAYNGTWALGGSVTYADVPFSGTGQIRVDLTGTGPGYQEAVQYATGIGWRRALTNPFSTPKLWGPWERMGISDVPATFDGDPGAPLETDLTKLTMWGDSLTAAGGVVARLAELVPSATIFNRGISGQTAAQVAARQGAVPSLLTVTGNVIPASGSVAVTARTVPLLAATGYPVVSLTGSLAGVPGTLANDAGGTAYTFTRATSGVAVTCPEKTPFITDHSRAARRNAHIIWAGRNNPELASTFPVITQMANFQSPAHKRVVVISVTNAPTEGRGTVKYEQITTINSQLAALLGECYIDLRRWLIDSGLAAVGVTPTTDDNTAIAADAVPPSLTTDGVHFTTAAQTAIGTYLHSRLVTLGWY